MDQFFHRFSELFRQLGLPSDSTSIGRFIAQNAALDSAIRLEDAPFWSAAQASFLKETVIDDADWSEVVDQLNSALRAPHGSNA